jgi:hypothetical protein
MRKIIQKCEASSPVQLNGQTIAAIYEKNTASSHIRLCTIHRNAACMASSSSSDGRKWLVLLF